MNAGSVDSASAAAPSLFARRKRVWSVVLYGFVTALPQIANGILAILYTRAFSSEEYANYGIFAAVLALLAYLIDFGLPAAILRNFNADQSQAKARVAASIFGGRLLMLAALPFAAALLYLFWDELGVRFTQTWAFIPVLLAIAYLTACSDILATVCRAMHRPGFFAAGRVAHALGTFIAGPLLVFGAHLGVMGALLAILLGEICALITYEIIVRRKLRIIHGVFSLPVMEADLAFSLPLVPNRLAGWMRQLAVRPILTHLVPMSSVGLFSFASSLATLPNLVSTAVDLALAPIYFQRRDASQDAAFGTKIHAFATIYLAAMFPLWVVAILFIPNAIDFVAGDEYRAAGPICTVLLCASYARMQLPFLSRQIHFLRKTWTLPLITIPSTLLGLALLIFLAGDYGILAAAWIAFVTDLLLLLSMALMVRRIEHIEYPVLTALVFTGALAVLAVWSSYDGLALFDPGTVLVKLLIAAAAIMASFILWIWPGRVLILQLAKG
jgi:O-antigen/teichoic acid export membrane protein